MRTTIDLPDELLRQAKARAALDGMRLRDLIEKGLRLALAMPSTPAPPRRVTFPLHRSRQPGTLTAEAVRRAEEQVQLDEDVAGHLRLRVFRRFSALACQVLEPERPLQ